MSSDTKNGTGNRCPAPIQLSSLRFVQLCIAFYRKIKKEGCYGCYLSNLVTQRMEANEIAARHCEEIGSFHSFLFNCRHGRKVYEETASFPLYNAR